MIQLQQLVTRQSVLGYIGSRWTGIFTAENTHSVSWIAQRCADTTATENDRLLASSCRPSVRLSVCDAVYCDSQGWCTGL